MKVVSFIESPRTDVIEAILKHCGLWESRSPRAPPEVHELVLELDPAYSGNALDAPNEAEESQELTYVDIDNFLDNYKFFPDPGRHDEAAPSREVEAYFALVNAYFQLGRLPLNSPPPETATTRLADTGASRIARIVAAMAVILI